RISGPSVSGHGVDRRLHTTGSFADSPPGSDPSVRRVLRRDVRRTGRGTRATNHPSRHSPHEHHDHAVRRLEADGLRNWPQHAEAWINGPTVRGAGTVNGAAAFLRD